MQPLYCPKKSPYPCAWCNSHHTYIVSSDERNPPFVPKPSFVPEWDPEDHRLYGKKKNRRFSEEPFYPDPRFNPWHVDPFGPRYPDEFNPLKPKKHDPHNFVIHCDDCHKYSNVKSVFCKICRKHDTIVTKIGPYVNPDDIFNPKHIHDYICNTCKIDPPYHPCNHNWVKHSGEIFSECTAINFVCSKCGEKKTTYSNQDRDPFGPPYYDFYS